MFWKNCAPVDEWGSAPLDVDDALRVLGHPDRRLLLRVLADLETPERLSTLARNLATYSDRRGDGTVRYVHYRLYHEHVPMLVEYGLVDYDERDRTVALTTDGAALASWFE